MCRAVYSVNRRPHLVDRARQVGGARQSFVQLVDGPAIGSNTARPRLPLLGHSARRAAQHGVGGGVARLQVPPGCRLGSTRARGSGASAVGGGTARAMSHAKWLLLAHGGGGPAPGRLGGWRASGCSPGAGRWQAIPASHAVSGARGAERAQAPGAESPAVVLCWREREHSNQFGFGNPFPAPEKVQGGF